MNPTDRHLGTAVRRALSLLPGVHVTDDERTRVEPVMNWGGFVHHSFRVASVASLDAVDAVGPVGAVGATYHVKLAADEEDLRDLRRWRRVSARLTDRYGAPPMVGWIDLESPRLAGPVLTWLDGASPTALDGPLRAAAVAVVQTLHSDDDLARILRLEGAVSGSCAGAYRSTYHRRFLADLDSVRKTRPSFVSADRLDWMEREARDVLRLVEATPAFDDPADRATHQDLWLNNLIVQPDGALRIIDWDGLALGDPMLDWTMLFGPAPGAFRIAEPGDLPRGAFSRSEKDRVGVLARASLLDWVIDPLADWIEAPPSSDFDDVRRAKRRVHEAALAAYRERDWRHEMIGDAQ